MFMPEPHQNPPEPHQASSRPNPSGTSQGLCTGTFGNLKRHLPRNLPEPHGVAVSETSRNYQVPAPKPLGPNQIYVTVTLRNLTEYLHRKRTSHGICTGTLRNLHKVSAPEPSGTSRGICTRTLRNLVQNLVLKLHRIAPELIWAKEAMAKFCRWGKNNANINNMMKDKPWWYPQQPQRFIFMNLSEAC